VLRAAAHKGVSTVAAAAVVCRLPETSVIIDVCGSSAVRRCRLQIADDVPQVLHRVRAWMSSAAIAALGSFRP
jgi:hypothetical protein